LVISITLVLSMPICADRVNIRVFFAFCREVLFCTIAKMSTRRDAASALNLVADMAENRNLREMGMIRYFPNIFHEYFELYFMK
jgi:hypothetical protein